MTLDHGYKAYVLWQWPIRESAKQFSKGVIAVAAESETTD